MAISGDDIQIDKGGFIRVHYAIFELLAKAPLTGGEFRCLMFLFRKTYGFNKKEDKISLAQWAEGTGMKRQNVWGILQTLLSRKIIYSQSTGPKRPNTWGFNKHHEQWDAKSVMSQHDSSVPLEHDRDDESVMLEDYRIETPVMPQHDKSVIPPHERTTDNKDKQLAADAIEDESGDSATALVVLAYQAICGVPPAMQSERGRANLVASFDLIEKYSYANCVRGLTTLKERQNTMFKKNGRDRIKAPLGYLRTIMEDEYAAPAIIPAPTTVNFALEELV